MIQELVGRILPAVTLHRLSDVAIDMRQFRRIELAPEEAAKALGIRLPDLDVSGMLREEVQQFRAPPQHPVLLIQSEGGHAEAIEGVQPAGDRLQDAVAQHRSLQADRFGARRSGLKRL